MQCVTAVIPREYPATLLKSKEKIGVRSLKKTSGTYLEHHTEL